MSYVSEFVNDQIDLDTKGYTFAKQGLRSFI